MEEAKQVMKFFGEYAEAAPDEMHVGTSLGASPGMPEPVAGIHFVWSGDPKDVDKLVAPIRKAGNPTEEKIDAWDYVSLQRSGDNDDPRANGSYARTGFVGVFSPDLVDALVDNFEMAPDRATWIGSQ